MSIMTLHKSNKGQQYAGELLRLSGHPDLTNQENHNAKARTKNDLYFKATAVRLSHLPGVAISDVASSLYIHPFMLSRWRKEMREGKIMAKGAEVDKDVAAELKELRKIKKDYERLQVEHDLLKKAIEFTSARKQMSSPSSTTTKKRTQ